jgi:hypothetical protein
MEKLIRPVSQICSTEASLNPLRASFSADSMSWSLLSCRVRFYELKQRENSMTNASAALEASPRKRSAQENPFHDGRGTDRGYLER